ncbi:MAG TPA: 3-hydroxy-3-methylglutaryl-CoA reductase, partial [Chloroflexi bacterium]|nr:3-hydroxy-3-methylglutaryl-CoA reductase [Chloroflexota bacterium]
MSEKHTSRLAGFYHLTPAARQALMAEQVALTAEELAVLSGDQGLTLERAEHMIENVIGLYGFPLGIATNFVVNGREVLVPMVIEEPSVVAGASLAAKLARGGGGFIAATDEPVMIGQIQVVALPDPHAARVDVLAHREELLALADTVDPVLQRLGGGARALEAEVLTTATGPMLIVYLHYDVRDAMGANAINTACERLAPR